MSEFGSCDSTIYVYVCMPACSSVDNFLKVNDAKAGSGIYS